MKKNSLALVAMILMASSNKTTNEDQNNCNQWQLVFKNDEQGKVISGNKKELRDAVRKGYPIRVGWGSRRSIDTTKSVEHFANASFLTIANSTEVFAQIDPIIGQNPNLDSDTLTINFRERYQWSLIVGSNGFSDRLNVDTFNDTIAGHRNRATEVSWFVKK